MSDSVDPFKPMQAGAPSGDTQGMLDTGIAHGKPRKNLMMVGVGVGVVAVIAWMLWPQSKVVNKAPTVQAQADPSGQSPSQMGSQVMRQLQDQAGASAPIGATAPSLSSQAPRAPIAPLPYQQASGAVAQESPAEKERKRQELIWSSAPSVQSVKLMKMSASAPVGASNASLSPLEAAKLALAQAMPKQTPMPMPPGPPTSPPSGSSNDQFLAAQSDAEIGDAVKERAAYRQSALLQGTVIRAVTLSGINTDLPGSISARVVSDVYDTVHPGVLVIPKGSTLIGRYSSDFKVGQSRVLVAMTRLILPDGRWISLSGAPATDTQGMSGMPADVNNHFFKMFSSAFVIGATSLLLPSNQQSTTVTQGATGSQMGGTVLAQALQQTVQQLLQRNESIKPTGTVPVGSTFDFMVSRDMLISPYEGSSQ